MTTLLAHWPLFLFVLGVGVIVGGSAVELLLSSRTDELEKLVNELDNES